MSVLICTPCYGGQVTEPYFRSCMTLRESLLVNGVHHDWLTITNESLVQRARNTIVSKFLETDYEKLFFIDADIEFTEHDFGKVYSICEDVSVGVYAMKDPKKARYAAWIDGELVTDLDQFNEPVEVDYAGTGFMCINRDVLERMLNFFPERAHSDGVGKSFAWFDPRVDDGIYLSEDYAFCKDVQGLMDCRVVMDPSVRLKHHGTYAYG